MGKYVQKYLVEAYQVEVFVVMLVIFIILFTLLVYAVYSKPKGYFQSESQMPLEDYNEESKN